MSFTYNQIILMGRLTREPEHHVFENGKEKLNFTLAVSRLYKNKTTEEYETDFIPVCLWGTTAATGYTLLKKGSPVLIWGRLQIRQYEKSNTEKIWITEVVADNYQLLESLKQYESRIQTQKDPTKIKDRQPS